MKQEDKTEKVCLDTYRNNCKLFKNETIFSEISKVKKIQKYTKKHSESKRIADLYTVLGYDETKKKSERELFLKKAAYIRDCNNSIYCCFNKETEETIYLSRFCKQRFCPICNYNDELKHFKIFSQIVNDEDVYNKKWLFITLTIKNTENENDISLTIQNLKKSIETIMTGFRSLTTSEKSFLKIHSLGMFRSLEITRNKHNGSFHPHLHLLVCVDESYNQQSKDWISKEKLQEHWRNACKLNYLPVVDIEYVNTDNSKNAVAEVSKYQTKSTDIINAETLYILTSVLSHTRMRGYTGIIKELKAKYETQSENEKIDLKEIVMNEKFVKCLLKWDCFKNCFRYDKKGSERLNNRLEEEKQEKEYLNNLADEILKNTEICL